ncbi:MAG: hypothetical protein LCH41_05490 [Armatimonadetes bacterium]|nr:hypothetical protein [Armatimonadota bacterium]
MDLIRALSGQYRANLAMLRQCLMESDEATWLGGEHPRTMWRICYHALYYTHLYLMPTEHDFVPWDKHRPCTDLWDEEGVLPPLLEPYTQTEMLEYLDWLDGKIVEFVSALDLESQESGFSWYPNLQKLDHQILNIRHLGIHLGQISERAMLGGVDEIHWKTRIPR